MDLHAHRSGWSDLEPEDTEVEGSFVLCSACRVAVGGVE